MEAVIPHWIFHNWQRKLVALLSAIVIWVLVDQSITSTKTLIGVPIKIINLPEGKTISGMALDGTLSRRMNLVISGKKNAIDNIESNDVEIILDASNVSDEWIVQIGKKNLVSLNEKIDLQRQINHVSHQEFIINLSNLITEKIPISIRPKGTLPEGYEYLGVWPQTLVQTVSGPEEQVLALRAKGIKLTFDLANIKASDLEKLTTVRSGYFEDEISFPMPETWKKVFIPFLGNNLQPINDPLAAQLHIDFLRPEFIKIENPLQIILYSPLKDSLNIDEFKLETNEFVEKQNKRDVLIKPIFGYGVSRLFWNIVREWTSMIITGKTKDGKSIFDLSVVFINTKQLEDQYVAFLRKRYEDEILNEHREAHWRERFRNYLLKFILYKTPEEQLNLKPIVENHTIHLRETQ